MFSRVNFFPGTLSFFGENSENDKVKKFRSKKFFWSESIQDGLKRILNRKSRNRQSFPVQNFFRGTQSFFGQKAPRKFRGLRLPPFGQKGIEPPPFRWWGCSEPPTKSRVGLLEPPPLNVEVWGSHPSIPDFLVCPLAREIITLNMHILGAHFVRLGGGVSPVSMGKKPQNKTRHPPDTKRLKNYF